MFHTFHFTLTAGKIKHILWEWNGKETLEAYSWYPSDFTQYVFPWFYILSVPINFIHKYNYVMSLVDYSSKSLN